MMCPEICNGVILLRGGQYFRDSISLNDLISSSIVGLDPADTFVLRVTRYSRLTYTVLHLNI